MLDRFLWSCGIVLVIIMGGGAAWRAIQENAATIDQIIGALVGILLLSVQCIRTIRRRKRLQCPNINSQ